MSIQTETLGFGWQLETGNTADYGTASTWTVLCGELTEVKPPTLKASDIATRHFNSPGQVDTFTPGWTNGGEPEFTAHYNYAEVQAIYAAFKVMKSWRIVAPYSETGGLTSSSSSGSSNNSNGVVEFNGYINSIEEKLNLDGLAEISFKVKVSGIVTFI